MAGLKKRTARAPWTAAEEALICRLRSKGWDVAQIAPKLPHRSPTAVQNRVARLLRVGRISPFRSAWTPEEDAVVCQLRAQGASSDAIARQLENRTAHAVGRRIEHLRADGRIGNVRKPPESRLPWTDEEEARLIELRERRATLKEMGAELHRSPGAIMGRIRELLEAEEVERAEYSPLSRRPWSPEEDELLAVLKAADKTASEIARALNRTVASVISRIRERVRKGERLETGRPPTTPPRSSPRGRHKERSSR